MAATESPKEDSPLLGRQDSPTYLKAREERSGTQESIKDEIEKALSSSGYHESMDFSNGDESDDRFSLRDLSCRLKLLLVLLILTNIFSGSAFSIIAPFFPHEAMLQEVSLTLTGLIFSVYEFMLFLTSPFFRAILPTVGPKCTFICGLYVGGLCAILFGLLDKSPAGNTFIGLCFAVRSFEALGMSASLVASLTIVSSNFPQHVDTVFGALEMARGFGLMVGPAIGGGLYGLGGYGLPFFVIGGLVLACGILLVFVLPTPGTLPGKQTQSGCELLRSPLVLVTVLVILAGSLSISFLDPTLALHLEEFNLSHFAVGCIFAIDPGLYSITAPVWGYFSETKNIQAPLVILGSLVCAIGFLIIGPCPLLDFIPFKLWVVILGLAVYGLCIGSVCVPTLKLLMTGAVYLGYEENVETFGIVSNLFTSAFCTGTFLGPTVGAILMDNLGFDWASSIVAALYLFALLCALICFPIYRCCCKNPEPQRGVLPRKGSLPPNLSNSRLALSYDQLSTSGSWSYAADTRSRRRHSQPSLVRFTHSVSQEDIIF